MSARQEGQDKTNDDDNKEDEVRPEVDTKQHDATNDNNKRAQQDRATIQQSSSIQPRAAEQPPVAVVAAGPAPPRRPRPNRPNLRRQVVVGPVVGGRDEMQVGVPLAAQIELAGVLQPGRATMMPPKRPAHLPTRLHHGRSAQTSLGATVSSSVNKPNRYSWAQMQQWHAAAAAASTGSQPGSAGGAAPSDQPHGFHYHFSSPFSSAASRVLVVNPIVNLGEHTKSRLIKFIEAIKRFSEKWFSHVLLLLFLAVYACLGAYVFISFEAPTEQWEKQMIIDTRQRIVNDSFDEARARSRDDYFEVFKAKFEEYERLLNKVCASGMTSSSLENQWTFWGALFYSMTVFTTIGYGHLTPITFAGRVATMVYAIFGIPILLMVLADLGKLLTRMIKYAFKKFRYLYNKLLRRKASVRTRKLISDNTNQYIGVARDAFERGFAYIQPYHQRIPHAFRVSTTRNESSSTIKADISSSAPSDTMAVSESTGNLAAHKMESTEVILTPAKQTKPVSPQPGQMGTKKSPLAPADQQHSGVSDQPHPGRHHGRSQSPALQAKRKISSSKNHPEAKKAQKVSVSRSSSSSNVLPSSCDKQGAATRPAAKGPAAEQAAPSEQQLQQSSGQQKVKPEVYGSDLNAAEEAQQRDKNEDSHQEHQGDDEELDDIDEDFDIPVSFALFLLITYMMFGAVVFSIWEGWNFFDALYFVFISMSTIGFGDLVPQHPKRMIGTFAYLLFGLALTSMCINVVQEKIHATFLRAKMQIGEKMGFDLDQIMADDYYDGGSAFDDDDDDLNSVAAVSQTNSSLGQTVPENGAASSNGAGHQQQPNGGDSGDHGQKKTTVPLDSGLEVGASQSGGARSSSKGKEAHKWTKKRSSGSDGGAGYGSGSLKRKSAKKQLARQVTPSASSQAVGELTPSQHQSVAKHQQKQDGAPPQETTTDSSAGAQSGTISPVKAEFEIVKSGIDARKTIEQCATDRPVGINQPINSVKAFCEPLRRAFQASGANENSTGPHQLALRPKLVATRSQPVSVAKSLDSSPVPHHQNNGINNKRNNYNSNASQMIERVQSQPMPMGGSLRSSRRASVSHELSQLDDLIVALSQSPPDRYGPLLGIPSTSVRSSRSTSPTSISNATIFCPSRRGTSMTSRSAGEPNSPRRLAQKKRLLVAQMPASARGPLNLSESQAALDELEAIKFSAV